MSDQQELVASLRAEIRMIREDITEALELLPRNVGH
jgi:hypothetical protein